MTERDLQTKIQFMIEEILVGVNKRHPHTMDELLPKNALGMNKTITKAITHKVTRLETTAFELLRASLGFIFKERYGWTEEKMAHPINAYLVSCKPRILSLKNA